MSDNNFLYKYFIDKINYFCYIYYNRYDIIM
jgi:hypothetical protein